ncbi:hypothetical protein DICPUDRAFT_34065 [Dictyostelium purpureum]|uniref:Importin subunit alpha n=1 Tax=Dictyostelium purpureum TaxID=5786 RepID=F0ZM18_DICPU|nr:uncharacterized protein DICPUDRAFT_34065 [Dictyostelium purpureum]EGC35022.1 hypothetical protein DICPUDRAFT_34065 [Dictyostelium purpureum]|eukprot:XP_003288450.1 hypothetical protein DICPUDRAFT_34065 [Dictyostelium purpureum]
MPSDEIHKMEQQIPNLIKDIHSDNPDDILHASTEIRKLLQIDNSPFLSKIINSGGLPTFIKLLSWDDHPQIQFECCWILTNLAASTSDHTKLLIDEGAIKPLVKLLKSDDESIRQQACWTLGNITCDSDENRDLILHTNAFPLILDIVKNLDDLKLETVQTVSWTISNILRSIREAPRIEYFKQAIPFLSKLLDYRDEEVLKDTCWSLVYGISQENIAITSRIQFVIDIDPLLCSKVIKLLYYKNIDLQTPSIRFISFISSDIINSKDNIYSKTLISSFYNLLQIPRISHMNDTIWSLSQIITADEEQIKELIDGGLVPILVNLLNNADSPVQIDIFLILSNSIVNTTSPKQLLYLLSQSCLKSILNFYLYGSASTDPTLPNEKLIRILLICIENILNIFLFDNNNKQNNQYYQQCLKNLQDSNGLLFLKKLQNHSNKYIKDKTNTILKKISNNNNNNK